MNRNEILYNQFGAFSEQIAITLYGLELKAYTINEIVKISGISYRLIRELVQNKEVFESLENDKFILKYYEDKKDIQEFDFSGIREKFSKIISAYSIHKSELDHISATIDTCFKRAIYLIENYDVSLCKILFLGDHDFTSIATALILKDMNIENTLYVADVDDDVISLIYDASVELKLNIKILNANFIYSFPDEFFRIMDIVLTDPPYTEKGIELFLTRSIFALKEGDFSVIMLCYKTAEKSIKLGLEIQKVFNKLGLLVVSLMKNFNSYNSAYAIGCSSNLIILNVAPVAYQKNSDANVTTNIYTHGINAVENNVVTVNTLINEFKTDDYLIIGVSTIDKSTITYKEFINKQLKGIFNYKKGKILVLYDNESIYSDYFYRLLLLFIQYDEFYVISKRDLVKKNKLYQFITCFHTMSYSQSVYHFSCKKRNKQIYYRPILKLKNFLVENYVIKFNVTKNEARELVKKKNEFVSCYLDSIIFELPVNIINSHIFSFIVTFWEENSID